MNVHAESPNNASQATQTTGPGFNSLGAAGLVFWLICSVGVGFLKGGAWWVVLGTIFGTFLGGLIVAALIAFIASRFSQNRRRTFNLTFVIVLFLALLGQFTQLGTAAQNARALNQLAETSEQVTADTADMIDRAVAGQDTSDEAEAQVGRMMGAFEDASHELTGEERIMMQVSHDMLAEVQKQMRRYNAALARLEESGGVDPLTLDSRRQIAERRWIIESFQQANEAFDRVYAELPAKAEAELTARGVSKGNVRAFVNGMSKQSRIDLIRRLRQKDREIVDAMLGMLNIFEASFDQWYVDTDGLVVFERDEDVDLFNQHFNDLNIAANEQVALQQQAATQLRK